MSRCRSSFALIHTRITIGAGAQLQPFLKSQSMCPLRAATFKNTPCSRNGTRFFPPHCIRSTQALKLTSPSDADSVEFAYIISIHCTSCKVQHSNIFPNTPAHIQWLQWSDWCRKEQNMTLFCKQMKMTRSRAFSATRLPLLQEQCISHDPSPPALLCNTLDFNLQIQTQRWRSSLQLPFWLLSRVRLQWQTQHESSWSNALFIIQADFLSSSPKPWA